MSVTPRELHTLCSWCGHRAHDEACPRHANDHRPKTITDFGNITICCGPPEQVTFRETEGVRWCFKCRRHVEFWYVVHCPSVEDMMATGGFYGPRPAVECANGHCDGDCFPGWSRTWSEVE